MNTDTGHTAHEYMNINKLEHRIGRRDLHIDTMIEVLCSQLVRFCDDEVPSLSYPDNKITDSSLLSFSEIKKIGKQTRAHTFTPVGLIFVARLYLAWFIVDLESDSYPARPV